MGVKRKRGRWQVDLNSTYVKLVDDEKTARMLEQHGKYLLELGKPLDDVVDELRGVTRKVPTLRAYQVEWAAGLTLPAATIADYQRRYMRFDASLGRKRLDRITSDDMRAAVKVASDKYSAKTVRISLAIVTAILRAAHDASLIDRVPRATNLPRVTDAGKRSITREEHRRLVAATQEPWGNLIALWPLVGTRAGEMLGLRWSDWEGDTLRIKRQRTAARTTGAPKTPRAVRTIDLTPQAVAVLTAQREVRDSDSLIFATSTGGYVSRTTLQRIFVNASEAAKVKVTPHDMRHAFGSWLLAAGVSVPYVSAQLGHANPNITMRVYAHEMPDESEVARRRFAKWLDGDADGDGDEAVS